MTGARLGILTEQTRFKFAAAVVVVLISVFSGLASAQEKPPILVRSWDLSVDADYAARTAKQLNTLGLEDAKIAFLDNEKLAITYADGRGASFSDGTVLLSHANDQATPSVPHLEQLPSRERTEGPLYKFHALIFDTSTGPGTAKHLTWDATREKAQFLPTLDGGFAVRVDNHVMVYSSNLDLEHEISPKYYGNRPLPKGEAFFGEYYSAGVSPTGHSLAICHSLLGRQGSGGIQVVWYDVRTWKQVGKESEVRRVGGCGTTLKVTDHTVYSGHYIVHPDVPAWQKVNPLCINCNGEAVPPDNKYNHYDLLDETHLLIYGKDDSIIDLDGHESYVMSNEDGVRVDKPDPDAPMPHAARAPRIAYDDGQPKDERGHRRSKRIHVVDWSQGRKLAVIKIIQDHSPVLHGGGLQLERLNLIDFSYALSPNGKQLAVLSMNSVKIYELP